MMMIWRSWILLVQEFPVQSDRHQTLRNHVGVGCF